MGRPVEVAEQKTILLPNPFIGGEFKRVTDDLKITRNNIPSELAVAIGPCEILTRNGYLQEYMRYVNDLLEQSASPIKAPVAIIDKIHKTGSILNPARDERPETRNGINPIVPGNESMTPPPLLVIRPVNNETGNIKAMDGSDWIVRIFVNAFPYTLPRKEIISNTEKERVETVCGLGLVVALNPAKKQLYDIHPKNTAMFEILLYALGKASTIIAEQGEYFDKNTGEIKKFDAALAYINEGPNAGGSLSKNEDGQPHVQIIALPEENTIPFYRGNHYDENGNCDRCRGIEEKTTTDTARVVGKTKHVLVYIPKHEAKRKGRMIRITPRPDENYKHCNNIISMSQNIRTLKDMALMLNDSIRAVALAQMKKNINQVPSFNVVFAQDLTDNNSHAFIDVLDGVGGGGYEIVGPVYHTSDNPPKTTADVLLQPPEIRETQEKVAKEFRLLVDFPFDI